MIFWYKPWRHLKGHWKKDGAAYTNVATYGITVPLGDGDGLTLVRGNVIVTPYLAEENLAAEVEVR